MAAVFCPDINHNDQIRMSTGAPKRTSTIFLMTTTSSNFNNALSGQRKADFFFVFSSIFTIFAPY